MFRAGYSWPNRQGGRSWVSGPAVLMLGAPFLRQAAYWLLIGWWLVPLYYGALLGLWVLLEAVILLAFLVMSVGVLIGTSKGKHYQLKIESHHGLIALWWV